MCFLLKSVLEQKLKQWKNKLLIILKLAKRLIRLITRWSPCYSRSHWWAVFFKAVKCHAPLWYIATRLTCLMSIAPTHCRQRCFALPHSIFFCLVCTILVISVFQRLHESAEKYFLSHQEGLLSLNIFAFLFLPFYTSLFTLSTGKLPIFYLSVLCLWFLLFLALYPSLSILTTIRHFKFLECALHDFVCIGAFYTCLYFGRYPSVQSSWETGQNKGKGFTQTDEEMIIYNLCLFFFFILIEASFRGIWFCPQREKNQQTERKESLCFQTIIMHFKCVK